MDFETAFAHYQSNTATAEETALPRPPSPLTMRLPRPKKPPLHLKKPLPLP